MEISRDTNFNVGYVKIVPNSKVAYSVAFDENYVADFDEQHNLVGIELLDAKSYRPVELQSLMTRANVEGVRQRAQGTADSGAKRSA